MDGAVALRILQLAKEGGFMDDDIPENPDEQLKLGEWWLEQAHKAADGGMDDNATVMAIIEYGKVGAVEEAAPEPLPDDEQVQALEEATPPENVVEEVAAEDEPEQPAEEEAPEPVGSPSPESTRESPVTESVRNHGHPVPPRVEGEVMPMPRDLTSLDDRQVRRLMGEYNALFARVTWEAAIEGADLTNSEHMRDHSLRVARRNVARFDLDGKKRNQSEIDDEAMADGEYIRWAEAHLEHDRQFRELRALKEIYEGHLERLSREASIRDQEYKRSV